MKNRKYENIFNVTQLCFFPILDVASVNTIFTTVAKIILFKFILTKSVLQISFIGLCWKFQNLVSLNKHRFGKRTEQKFLQLCVTSSFH